MNEFGDRSSHPVATLQRHIGVYSLQRELGRGGASTVYEAIDTRNGNVVALKALASVPYLQDEEQMSLLVRMERETRAVESLSHPNVVHILEVGFAGESPETLIPFFAMEFLNGRTVRERLDRDGPLPLSTAAHILDQAASALDAVHAAGVVHRDIKPGNLMLLDDDFVKLMDFGIARQGDDMTVTKAGMMIGSPAYMSPEQAAGRPATAQSDVWGLGAVLYEMVTGTVAFDADNIPALLYQISYGSPHPPPVTLPTSVRALLTRALGREAGQRFATAGALAAAFRAAVADPEPPPVRRPAKSILPPSLTPASSGTSRSDNHALAYAIPLAVIAVVSVGAYFALRPRPHASVTAPVTEPSGRRGSDAADKTTKKEATANRLPAVSKPAVSVPHPPTTAPTTAVPVAAAPLVKVAAAEPVETVTRPTVVPTRVVVNPQLPKPVVSAHRVMATARLAPSKALRLTVPINRVVVAHAPTPPTNQESPADDAAAFDTSTDKAEPANSSAMIGSIGGMWKGTYASHPAVLIVNRPSSDNGLFDGTLSVSTKDGDIMVNIRGHMKDDGTLKFHEQNVISGSAKDWSLGSVSGNVDASGAIVGGGRAANGNAYGWTFHRE